MSGLPLWILLLLALAVGFLFGGIAASIPAMHAGERKGWRACASHFHNFIDWDLYRAFEQRRPEGIPPMSHERDIP